MEVAEDSDYILLEDEHISVLSGMVHYCPICFNQLTMRDFPGVDEEHWYCKSCGTEWEVMALIRALNYDELKGEDYEASEA